MTRYRLDTNLVSHLVRQHPAVRRHIVAVPMTVLYIPAIAATLIRIGYFSVRKARFAQKPCNPGHVARYDVRLSVIA
jgi:tRNA(fMet)-specific endonuclease VapC